MVTKRALILVDENVFRLTGYALGSCEIYHDAEEYLCFVPHCTALHCLKIV